MPAEIETADPALKQPVLPGHEEQNEIDIQDPYVVILYNDDYHPVDQVVSQVQKATGYDLERCIRITLEAHTRGRAIAYTGSSVECERAAAILRQIRLQVETDRF
jgi:ATP-dependent Clp protease adapter protein ClpS